jgi:hypothetical protein
LQELFKLAQKVLIAVAEKTYTDILRDLFLKHSEDFVLSSQEVFHRRFLEEMVENERPDILLIHDSYLESEYVEQEKKDEEMLFYIKKFRLQYEEELRIVYLCERPKGDPFLSKLVSLGVRDIFNANSFDLDEFVNQLKDKPKFSRVAKFLIEDYPSPKNPEQRESIENEEEGDEEGGEENDVAASSHEKPVIQKVVHKNVIKRDYKIQITNQVEKLVGVPINKKLVLLGGFRPRSGVTFIAHLLARSLAKMGIMTTYVECPFAYPYTYDRFAGQRFSNDYRSKFYQFSKHSDSQINRVYDWKIEDVQIICKHPEEIYKSDEVTFETFVKVLFSTSSVVNIIDVGTFWNFELLQDVYDIADHVYIVFEPDISEIQRFEESHEETIAFLRTILKDEKTHFIGNRFPKQLLKDEIFSLYKSKIKAIFPVFPVIDVYFSQFQSIFLNDLTKEYQGRIDPCIQPLLEDILPGEILKSFRKKNGLFSGLFKKKITVQKTETKGEEAPI